MITPSLRRKFIKDNGLPIPSVEDEQFKYFMALYDPVFNCISKYKLFVDTVTACGGESGYSAQVVKFIECMVEAISSTESFRNLSKMGKNSDYVAQNVISSKDIYHADFADFTMISVDLRSANFHALQSFDESIVLGASSYEELAYMFTNYQYIAENKQLRQTVFGKCAPTKQVQIQKVHLQQLCDNILREYPYFELTLMGSDELIVTSYGDLSPIDAWLRVKDCIPSTDHIKAEIFTLRQIHPDRHYFTKIPWILKGEEDSDIYSVDGYLPPVFKSVPGIFFAQVYKKFFDMEIVEDDLVFVHEGIPAKFTKSIYE